MPLRVSACNSELCKFVLTIAFLSLETDEEIQSTEKHKETIEIQHSEPQPQDQKIPETTTVTKTFQISDQTDDSLVIPEETTHTEAIRIDHQKQTVLLPGERPSQELVPVEQQPRRRPGATIEIHVGGQTPSTTETVHETTTFTTTSITSQVQVSYCTVL